MMNKVCDVSKEPGPVQLSKDGDQGAASITPTAEIRSSALWQAHDYFHVAIEDWLGNRPTRRRKSGSMHSGPHSGRCSDSS